MPAADDQRDIVLHVWPGRWDCPSINPECLAAILLLQLSVPGQFTVQECVTPDLSPSGQLPYLTCGLTTITSLPSILKYASSLKQKNDADYSLAELDDAPEHVQQPQQTAWISYVQAHLGDLLAYAFYGSQANYNGITVPTIASMLSVPERYYVPGRLRDSYVPRLKAAGLWNVAKGEQAKNEQREKFKEAFAKEKVQEKARMSFNLLTSLLGTRAFFYSNHPSDLDAVLAAYTLLLLKPPFPENTVSVLLTSSYPSLISHAQRVFDIAFQSLSDSLQVLPPETLTLGSITSLIPWGRSVSSFWRTSSKREMTEEEKKFQKLRWQWYGVAGLAILGWAVVIGSTMRIRFMTDEELEEEEEEEMEEGDEEEEEDD